ncbi:cell wall integrity and stress response protein 1 [Bifidobacterium margollesii]|uniref:Cell wall integrity and stress response protein 1 n=1 Tax=Bifidobacterium margollesii TaxID=2020964 RepID=A0A2N5J7F7_9BIFI|nr:LytR C-terminal domain-containing protein [Bifidobacterium margollesii]PLS30143.1 cell wall integrity and stress response protein 1 [Bifidobacterium margollesii]
MNEKKPAAYPTDEFDNPPQGPVGLHRGPRSFGARALPYLVVAVVAVVCGLIVFFWASGTFAGNGSASSSSSSSSQTASAPASSSKSAEASGTASAAPSSSAASAASPSASASQSVSASQSPSQSQSSSPAAAVNKASSVVVYNGTSRTGYAAQQVAVLQQAGYTSVTPSNPRNRSTLPQNSTVWYQSEADLATAQDIAAKLGIAQVAQVTTLGTPVAVVLMQ